MRDWSFDWIEGGMDDRLLSLMEFRQLFTQSGGKVVCQAKRRLGWIDYLRPGRGCREKEDGGGEV